MKIRFLIIAKLVSLLYCNLDVCLSTWKTTQNQKKGYEIKRQSFLAMREIFCTQDQVMLLFTLCK